MADEPLTICLMGDTKFGKTSLIASLRGCVSQLAYGFEPSRHFEFRVLGQSLLSPQNFASGSYNDIEGRLFGAGQGTAVERTFQYEFEIRLTRYSLHPAATEVCPIRIHDTGGAVWMSNVKEYVAENSIFLENFERYRDEVLPQATGLILVIPLFETWEVRNEVPWRDRMSELLEAVTTDPRFNRIRRIAVAMTHYERLFVNFGAAAARVASDPTVAKEVLKEAVGRMRKQQLAVQLLTRHNHGRQIFFMPVSAHGFVRGNGCPNFDPSTNLLLRRTLGEANESGRRELWRPFCTADPFLFAGTGEKGLYMFTYAELADESDLDRRAPDTPDRNGGAKTGPHGESGRFRPALRAILNRLLH